MADNNESKKVQRANNQVQMSIRLPEKLIEFIDEDVANGNYSSRADWVRSASENFRSKRIEEIVALEKH